MFQNLLKNKIFRNKINEFFKKNKIKLIDIILFGSTIKGKAKPNDIDILLIFKEKVITDLEYELKKELEYLNIEINIIGKNYNSMMSETFFAREAILAEGYSLINDNFISSELGYKNFILFKYELNGFNQSKRMRFQYSLYGREKKGGMIKELSLIKFSDSILLSNVENYEKTKDYLNSWNIKFEDMPILIPSRLF